MPHEQLQKQIEEDEYTTDEEKEDMYSTLVRELNHLGQAS